MHNLQVLACILKKFCGIFRIIDRNDTELIWAIYQKNYLRQGWVVQLLLIQIAELQMPIGILASGLAYVIPYPSARRDFCIEASRRWHILIPDWNRQHHHPALFYHTYSTWFHSFRPPFWIASLILFCFECLLIPVTLSDFQAIHAYRPVGSTIIL